MFMPMNCPTCRKQVQAEAKTDRWSAVCPECGGRLATPAGFVPGTVLGGYTIESRLASSSAEETYLGTQPALGRQVMVKILPPDMVNDAESFGRFRRQMKLTATLRHPGILGAIDAGEDAGMHYLVTEYKPGRTLKEYLAAKGPRLPEKEALPLIGGIAEALRYAWEEHAVLDRNIKPGAILLTDDGKAVLMDLGLAKSYREHAVEVTLTGYTVGTPEYMSPEQARGDESIDFRADVYSLGIVLYQCVVGAVPFASKNAMEVLGRQLDETPVPARQANPEVSVRCSALIDRMLAKTPDKRCQSWGEIIEEMRAIATAKPAAVPAAAGGKSREPARPGTPRGQPLAASVTPARTPAAIKSEAAFKRTVRLLYVIPPLVTVIAIVIMVAIVQRSRAPKPSPAAVPSAVTAPAAGTQTPAITEPGAEPARPKPAAGSRRDEEMLDYAKQYYREHPADYAGAIGKLRTVREQLAGTKYALMADETIGRVEADRAKAAGETMAGLKRQADPLAAAGDFTAAIALYDNYRGTLATETAASRRAAVEDLRRREAAARTAEDEKAAALERQIDEAAAAAAKACLGGKPAEMAAASKQLQALAGQTAAREIVQAWEAFLAATGGMDAQVLRTFAAGTGKPLQVRFEKDGMVEIEVKAIEGGVVQADRLVREGNGDLKGRIEMRFTAGDLHLSEKLARLRQNQAPQSELLCGLAAWRAGNRKLAADCFRGVDGPVAQRLLVQCGE